MHVSGRNRLAAIWFFCELTLRFQNQRESTRINVSRTVVPLDGGYDV